MAGLDWQKLGKGNVPVFDAQIRFANGQKCFVNTDETQRRRRFHCSCAFPSPQRPEKRWHHLHWDHKALLPHSIGCCTVVLGTQSFTIPNSPTGSKVIGIIKEHGQINQTMGRESTARPHYRRAHWLANPFRHSPGSGSPKKKKKCWVCFSMHLNPRVTEYTVR